MEVGQAPISSSRLPSQGAMPDEFLRKYLSEIQTMLQFCRDEGKTLSEECNQLVATLFSDPTVRAMLGNDRG